VSLFVGGYSITFVRAFRQRYLFEPTVVALPKRGFAKAIKHLRVALALRIDSRQRARFTLPNANRGYWHSLSAKTLARYDKAPLLLTNFLRIDSRADLRPDVAIAI
jgi:hypothetical protein